eukprot:scaffold1302_cov245-Pinguiococcus_pyrenoidosus.AAC.2
MPSLVQFCVNRVPAEQVWHALHTAKPVVVAVVPVAHGVRTPPTHAEPMGQICSPVRCLPSANSGVEKYPSCTDVAADDPAGQNSAGDPQRLGTTAPSGQKYPAGQSKQLSARADRACFANGGPRHLRCRVGWTRSALAADTCEASRADLLPGSLPLGGCLRGGKIAAGDSRRRRRPRGTKHRGAAACNRVRSPRWTEKARGTRVAAGLVWIGLVRPRFTGLALRISCGGTRYRDVLSWSAAGTHVAARRARTGLILPGRAQRTLRRAPEAEAPRLAAQANGAIGRGELAWCADAARRRGLDARDEARSTGLAARGLGLRLEAANAACYAIRLIRRALSIPSGGAGLAAVALIRPGEPKAGSAIRHHRTCRRRRGTPEVGVRGRDAEGEGDPAHHGDGKAARLAVLDDLAVHHDLRRSNPPHYIDSEPRDVCQRVRCPGYVDLPRRLVVHRRDVRVSSDNGKGHRGTTIEAFDKRRRCRNQAIDGLQQRGRPQEGAVVVGFVDVEEDIVEEGVQRRITHPCALDGQPRQPHLAILSRRGRDVRWRAGAIADLGVDLRLERGRRRSSEPLNACRYLGQHGVQSYLLRRPRSPAASARPEAERVLSSEADAGRESHVAARFLEVDPLYGYVIRKPVPVKGASLVGQKYVKVVALHVHPERRVASVEAADAKVCLVTLNGCEGRRGRDGLAHGADGHESPLVETRHHEYPPLLRLRDGNGKVVFEARVQGRADVVRPKQGTVDRVEGKNEPVHGRCKDLPTIFGRDRRRIDGRAEAVVPSDVARHRIHRIDLVFHLDRVVQDLKGERRVSRRQHGLQSSVANRIGPATLAGEEVQRDDIPAAIVSAPCPRVHRSLVPVEGSRVVKNLIGRDRGVGQEGAGKYVTSEHRRPVVAHKDEEAASARRLLGEILVHPRVRWHPRQRQAARLVHGVQIEHVGVVHWRYIKTLFHQVDDQPRTTRGVELLHHVALHGKRLLRDYQVVLLSERLDGPRDILHDQQGPLVPVGHPEPAQEGVAAYAVRDARPGSDAEELACAQLCKSDRAVLRHDRRPCIQWRILERMLECQLPAGEGQGSADGIQDSRVVRDVGGAPIRAEARIDGIELPRVRLDIEHLSHRVVQGRRGCPERKVIRSRRRSEAPECSRIGSCVDADGMQSVPDGVEGYLCGPDRRNHRSANVAETVRCVLLCDLGRRREVLDDVHAVVSRNHDHRSTLSEDDVLGQGDEVAGYAAGVQTTFRDGEGHGPIDGPQPKYKRIRHEEVFRVHGAGKQAVVRRQPQPGDPVALDDLVRPSGSPSRRAHGMDGDGLGDVQNLADEVEGCLVVGQKQPRALCQRAIRLVLPKLFPVVRANGAKDSLSRHEEHSCFVGRQRHANRRLRDCPLGRVQLVQKAVDVVAGVHHGAILNYQGRLRVCQIDFVAAKGPARATDRHRRGRILASEHQQRVHHIHRVGLSGSYRRNFSELLIRCNEPAGHGKGGCKAPPTPAFHRRTRALRGVSKSRHLTNVIEDRRWATAVLNRRR